MVDLRGPRLVVEMGVVILVAGLCLATLAREVWQLYATLGLLVGVGGNMQGYSVESVILPSWGARKRGLTIGIAFSGVGIGSVLLLPWLQTVIAHDGWRFGCLALALIIAIVLFPLNLLLRRRPQDLGLYPDGDAAPQQTGPRAAGSNIVDAAWAATTWTLSRAARTARFWWIAIGYFSILYAWYAVQVHQTK